MVFINLFKNTHIQIGKKCLMHDNGRTAHDNNDFEAAYRKRLAASKSKGQNRKSSKDNLL